MSISYRPDWASARERLTDWWNGIDIGRPAMQIVVPRSEPKEQIEVMPEPDGWLTHYSTKSLAYRVNLARRSCIDQDYLAEAVPSVSSGDLAPNCLALFLGCRGIEAPGTVWMEPCIASPETARLDYDENNFYWRFCRDAFEQTANHGDGKFIQSFPDLIEGLDTLGAMRGTEQLLIDMLERPDWVKGCLRQITDRYFHYYDILYDMLRDEVGGSVFWAWAPGRIAKFQCDISALFSPEMFCDFMVPVLQEMTERVSYSMYHLDGPEAIAHLDALLSLPRLTMIQWTPGAGEPGTWDRTWWPLYHQVLAAGKKLLISARDRDDLLALRQEFGQEMNQFMIRIKAPTRKEALAWMQSMLS